MDDPAYSSYLTATSGTQHSPNRLIPDAIITCYFSERFTPVNTMKNGRPLQRVSDLNYPAFFDARTKRRIVSRETHFCPGLAVEPVSHRRKDRNLCDLSFRFHECWSSGSAASDGSNSVSIFGAGWARTKYSRPISSCRIGSGNISASRAYCERCAAIAAIFCWT